MPATLAGIGDFINALRHGGIDVGPDEMHRLEYLFRREPHLDRHGLKILLGALLLKNPSQSDLFDALFDTWCPDQDADWHASVLASVNQIDSSRQNTNADTQSTNPHTFSSQRTDSSIFGISVTLVMVLLALGWFGYFWLTRDEPVMSFQPTVHKPSVSSQSATDDDRTSAGRPVVESDKVWYWNAHLTDNAVQVPTRVSPLELIFLALIAGGLAGTLIIRHRRRFPAFFARQRSYRGIGWQALPSPVPIPIIAARERRRIAWQIERFVSDELTKRLDLERTVAATARAGGVIQPCFEPSAHERVVWFWLDRQLQSVIAHDVVVELSTSLHSAGLQVHQGYFTEVPYRIDTLHYAGYRPLCEEGSGRQAVVAVLCDGAGLARQLVHPLYKDATQRLLRSLRHWPRLCFIDCSPDARRLSGLLKGFQLTVITPEQLPRWLTELYAESQLNITWDDHLIRDGWLWSAALAFGGNDATASDAHELRAVLELDVNPWKIDQVLATSRRQRYALINRLLRCEPLSEDGLLPEGGVAECALKWWQDRYTSADHEQLTKENPLLPWRNSLAQDRWCLKSTLLYLYTDPIPAAKALAGLVEADKQLAQELRLTFGTFRAADDPRVGRQVDDHIVFTWRFTDLPRETRHCLQQLGFDFPLSRRPGQLSTRLVLALVSLVGLALTGFIIAGYQLLFPIAPLIKCDSSHCDSSLVSNQTVRLIEPNGDGTYRITLGSVRGELKALTSVPAGATVDVSWNWQSGYNPYVFDNANVQILRTGTLAQPIRACGDTWPARSLTIIHAERDDSSARQLAIRLLDKGSSDQVMIGTDWPRYIDQWYGPSLALNLQTQLLLILPDNAQATTTRNHLRGLTGAWAIVTTADLARLAEAFDKQANDTAGVEAVETAKLPWRLQSSQGTVHIYRGPKHTVDSDTGIEWVHLCPGTFAMGEDDSRIVSLSAYQIAATETTHANYNGLFRDSSANTSGQSEQSVDSLQSEGPGSEPSTDRRDDHSPLPPTTWARTREICKRAGGDLPTEAQWEYAARGGSSTTWSFGNNERQLADYAWFDENADGILRPVGQKRPNPLGLYDTYGNVSEWTQDWHDKDYESGVFIDPPGPANGRYRVVRGGSRNDPATRLRSAHRTLAHPSFGKHGFRCVRTPPSH